MNSKTKTGFSISSNKDGLAWSGLILIVGLTLLAWHFPDQDYYLESRMIFGAPGSDVIWIVKAGMFMVVGSVWSWFWSWSLVWVPVWYCVGIFIQRMIINR